MKESMILDAGTVLVEIVDDEQTMGAVTARRVAAQVRAAVDRGEKPVLWLMAAPSGFAFYRGIVAECAADAQLARIIRTTPIYQFDDYPVSRDDPRFPVTFRALLEEHLFGPLGEVCGELSGSRPLELSGNKDQTIASGYAAELEDILNDRSTYVVQVKGIGMDGHWGFHGAETPLDAPPGIIQVAMGPQNVRQQRIDWPDLFPTDESVPSTAFSATVSLFMRADYIIDNVPQVSKQYSTLACYGTNDVVGAVPSSILKTHPNAHAVLTRAASRALVDYRVGRESGHARLSDAILARLDGLWDDPESPATADENRAIMRSVLRQLGMIGD